MAKLTLKKLKAATVRSVPKMKKPTLGKLPKTKKVKQTKTPRRKSYTGGIRSRFGKLV